MPDSSHSRRSFLTLLAGAVTPIVLGGTGVAASCASGRAASGTSGGSKHPDPRPGIDASRVLPADRVPADVAELYDRVREIPGIIDGIRCPCGCADLPGVHSLLSCYEESGMAQHCTVCQSVGELATRLHWEGRTLVQIRAAIDRQSW
jgi:hypothetical protein